MSFLNFGKISYQQPPALIIKHVPRLRAPSLRSNPITFPRKSWPRQRQRSTSIQAAANLSCTACCSFTDRSFRIGFHSRVCSFRRFNLRSTDSHACPHVKCVISSSECNVALSYWWLPKGGGKEVLDTGNAGPGFAALSKKPERHSVNSGGGERSERRPRRCT